MSACIGIDLGTSNTVTAVCVGSKPTIIPNAEGERSTPSIVAIDARTGKALVGTAAKRQAVLNPGGTVFSVKRMMGAYFAEVQHECRRLPYEVVRSATGEAHIKIGDRTFAPPEIAGMILKKARQDAAAFLGEDVLQAVVTVPAYFNDRQRRATRTAAELAGLEVLRIINEPTAAALAYGLSKPEMDYCIAVVHLGGGTLDISTIDCGKGVYEVKSVSGDTRLGGDDFDNCIIDWAAGELRRLYGLDAYADVVLLEMLRWEAERAKCDLSTRDTAELVFPYLRSVNSDTYNTISVSLARSVLEERAKPLIDRIAGPCKSAMKNQWGPLSVHHVILVGQQTRMPAIREAVARLFGKQPRLDVDPGEVVALGAAVQASVLKGQRTDVVLVDAIPISLGIETLGGVFTTLIERNTRIPTYETEIFSTAADNQTDVTIKVFQGERKMAADNLFLGEFSLTGISPAPRGVPQVEVKFDIDANCVLLVSAKDLSSGRQHAISIGGVRTMKASLDGRQMPPPKKATEAKQTTPEQSSTARDAAAGSPSTGAWLKRLLGKRKRSES